MIEFPKSLYGGYGEVAKRVRAAHRGLLKNGQFPAGFIEDRYSWEEIKAQGVDIRFRHNRLDSTSPAFRFYAFHLNHPKVTGRDEILKWSQAEFDILHPHFWGQLIYLGQFSFVGTKENFYTFFRSILERWDNYLLVAPFLNHPSEWIKQDFWNGTFHSLLPLMVQGGVPLELVQSRTGTLTAEGVRGLIEEYILFK